MAATDIHANFFNAFLKPFHQQEQEPQSQINYAAERAARMYDDWQTPPSQWPVDVRCRQNTPHAFHAKLGRWVPTSSAIGFYADVREWLNMMDDRKDYQTTFQVWYDQPRPSRTPYLSLQ